MASQANERLGEGDLAALAGPRKKLYVDTSIAQRLRRLNATFYETYADSFAATRKGPWPGWSAVPAIDGPVLDLGCGNGRYLRFLRRRGHEGRFVGIDSSAALIAKARGEFTEPGVEWRVAGVQDFLKGCEERFEHVVAWGVLHHIPGEENRTSLIKEMLARVAPGGTLWLSLWQFRLHERFAKNECDPMDHGFVRGDLEAGDALLDWQGERGVPRYCHHFSNEEIARIVHHFAAASPRVHRSEAASDRFNAYVAMTPEAERR